MYLSGCTLPDCHLTYDIPDDTLTLFIPPLDPDSVVWSGLPLSIEDALNKYDIDDCRPSTELADYFKKEVPDAYLATTGRGDESVLYSTNKINTTALHTAIDHCRVTKDQWEIDAIKHANTVTTQAHIAALQSIKQATNEQDCTAAFLARCISLGCKEQAYSGIFGSGVNAATLHYQDNDQPLAGRSNMLVDAAAEWECYCSDVTRTFPLSKDGFDQESESIYIIVQSMQDACFKMLHAGVQWEDVHVKAHEVAVEGLLALGLLKGDKSEIMKARTSVAFFPHGLGHYLGLDTHDCGGNPDYEDKDPMFKYLRVRGTLPEGSVITVEPGVYFCRFIVEPYLKDDTHKKFIDEAVLERYWDIGGVRIEGMCSAHDSADYGCKTNAEGIDDVLITKDGYENLTTAPKDIDEMVGIINGQKSLMERIRTFDMS